MQAIRLNDILTATVLVSPGAPPTPNIGNIIKGTTDATGNGLPLCYASTPGDSTVNFPAGGTTSFAYFTAGSTSATSGGFPLIRNIDGINLVADPVKSPTGVVSPAPPPTFTLFSPDIMIG